MELGLYAEALPHVLFVSQKHVDDNEVNGAAWEKALSCYINMKRYNEALATLDTITLHFPDYENGTLKRAFILDKMDKIGLDGVAEELAKEGYAKESIDKYLGLFKGVEEAGNGIDGICYIAKTLEGFLEEDVEKNLLEIINSVNAAKQADFKLVFDPTLVRGMSYYTGTIFEIAMPELGAACGGGGRYDKMVGKFTGQDVPACGFSIGFERIVLLLMESGFTVPMQRPKVAYLIEKGYPADKLVDVIAKAQEERQAGKQVLVVRMNKNKKFQKEKLAAEGYKDIVEFFNN